ncbi:MAG: hypothetical protein AAB367_01950 [Patescibacteria group bacterium]
MAKSAVVAHYEKAEAFFDTLIAALRLNQPPYSLPEARVPQDRKFLPPNIIWGSPRHARFLFKLCYWMRGRIESIRAVIRLAAVHNKSPEIFEPRIAALMGPENITQTLIRGGMTNQARALGPSWVENAKRLVERCDGDVVALLQDVRTYEDACVRIRNDKEGGGFIGFQHKMVSMLLYYLMSCEFIDYFVFPAPVDFHVLRLLRAHGILEFSENERNVDDSILQPAREICARYCDKKGVSALDLTDVLWLLSNTFCNRHPGNLTQSKKYAARKTKLMAKPFVWSETNEKRYEQTCGRCPVIGTCQMSIPSASYYIQGKLSVRGPILAPPQLTLFSSHHHAKPPAKE